MEVKCITEVPQDKFTEFNVTVGLIYEVKENYDCVDDFYIKDDTGNFNYYEKQFFEVYKTCKYSKESPQPKNMPYPRISYNSECGFNLVINEGYVTDYRDYDNLGKEIKPKGNCLKCKKEITLKN